MRWSRAFISTLREDPAGVESASHRLLLRGGYIQQIGSGIYSLLPLAQRVRRKLMRIIREELDGIGAQECLLSALSPTEYWKQSGRLNSMGDIMFRLKDRKSSELVLGVTHEEIFTHIASKHINSYKQLPQMWYQFQTKFRDELRPRGGLLRVREFTMKDSYSFDIDENGLDQSYNLHKAAYEKIFARCGLQVNIAEADSGIMGGAQSAEFLLITESGEDKLVVCPDCSYNANLEKALGRVSPSDDGPEELPLEKFATPGIRTIAELESFEDGVVADRQIKTLIFKGAKRLHIILVRGDQELNEVALAVTLKEDSLRPAEADEIFSLMGAHPGSLGAVNFSSSDVEVVADLSLKGRFNMQTGANEDDFHFKNVSVERDIKVDRWENLRLLKEGESCLECGGSLKIENALEVGHIFKLGTKYSHSLGATALKEDGSKIDLVMGSYGIGVERLMAAIVETSHDEKGIVWPVAAAPYQILITPVNMNDSTMAEVAEEIYGKLLSAGHEVLLDDRQVRAGVKFNDGDLIGIPIRVTVGKKAVNREVEVFSRRTGATTITAIEDLGEVLSKCLSDNI